MVHGNNNLFSLYKLLLQRIMLHYKCFIYLFSVSLNKAFLPSLFYYYFFLTVLGGFKCDIRVSGGLNSYTILFQLITFNDFKGNIVPRFEFTGLCNLTM